VVCHEWYVRVVRRRPPHPPPVVCDKLHQLYVVTGSDVVLQAVLGGPVMTCLPLTCLVWCPNLAVVRVSTWSSGRQEAQLVLLHMKADVCHMKAVARRNHAFPVVERYDGHR
jgi:hypothetical protein